MSSSNRGNIDSIGSSSFKNRADSLVDIDYANADNYEYYQASRMATAVAEQTEVTTRNDNTTTNNPDNNNSNVNDNFDDNYYNNYHNISNYRNNANTNTDNTNDNGYNVMMTMMQPAAHNTGNVDVTVASGFRYLHRDYLRDLEDAVVLALPWPTPNDRQEVSDLLRRRSVSKTRANEINTCVVTYWIASIGVCLLLYYIGAVNSSRRAAVTLLLGLSYVISLLILVYGHVRYYRLDNQVQFLVRAIMDANGLGYLDPQQDQYHPRDHPLLRNDVSQMPQFRLPEFVDVMLRTVVVADGCNANATTNSLDDEFSAVTFRDSLMKSVTSGSTGNGTAAGASAGASFNGTTDNAKSGNGVFSLSRRIMSYDG
mmetsp:Transcript_9108/g.19707  ORF Transcript_9108/g.19707 Transcript_9108/m.19707 type:complete len:370 (-) Transcript_9108:121-1230(-)